MKTVVMAKRIGMDPPSFDFSEELGMVSGHFGSPDDSETLPLSSLSSNGSSIVIVSQDEERQFSMLTELQPPPSLDSQRRLDELINENLRLRNKLTQKDLTMKSQYEALISWEEAGYKVVRDHREKFSHAKNYIFKLKEENARLRDELGETGASMRSNRSDVLFEGLLAQLKEKEEVLKESMTENQKLREEISRLNKLISELEKQKSVYPSYSFPDNAMPLGCSKLASVWRKDVSPLVEVVEPKIVRDMRDEMLRRKMSVLTDQVDWADRPDEESLEALGPITIGGEKLHECERLKSLNEELNRRIHETTEIVLQKERLEAELRDKNKLLADALDECASQKAVAAQNERFIVELNSKTILLKTALVECEQLKAVLAQKEDLEVELDTKNSLLNAALNELTYERAKLVEMDALKEQLELLRAKADVYKTDYEEERHARQKLVGEKEEYAEEIRKLRATLQATGARSEEPRAASASSRTSDGRIDPPQVQELSAANAAGAVMPEVPINNDVTFTCPMCQSKFEVLADIERHANQCLDERSAGERA